MSDGPVTAPHLVLASASPRRAELLERVGLGFEVEVPDVDESVLPGERPEDYVARVAAAKARTVADRHPTAVVLAADTAVVLDDVPLGKPEDAADARRMLGRLSGRTHRVLTAVHVVGPGGSARRATVGADVRVATLSDDEIAAYVRTGEPLDKAGAYALQGRGAALVVRIDGDPTAVIGLPLRTTLEMLAAAGISS
jgi:nucleoside triphosphate pyrophosphatase